MEKDQQKSHELSIEQNDKNEDQPQDSNQHAITKQLQKEEIKNKMVQSNYEKQLRADALHVEQNDESDLQNLPIQNDSNENSQKNYQTPQDVQEQKKITITYVLFYFSQQQIPSTSETKNMSNHFAKQLKNYIKNIQAHTNDPQLKKMLQNNDVKKFLHTNVIGKKKLDDFIQSETGQIIASNFFGNCNWINRLVKKNTTNFESYFRHNNIYFYETQKAKQIQFN